MVILVKKEEVNFSYSGFRNLAAWNITVKTVLAIIWGSFFDPFYTLAPLGLMHMAIMLVHG